MPTNRCEECYEFGWTVPVPHPTDPKRELRLCADCDQERSRKIRPEEGSDATTAE